MEQYNFMLICSDGYETEDKFDQNLYGVPSIINKFRGKNDQNYKINLFVCNISVSQIYHDDAFYKRFDVIKDFPRHIFIKNVVRYVQDWNTLCVHSDIKFNFITTEFCMQTMMSLTTIENILDHLDPNGVVIVRGSFFFLEFFKGENFKYFINSIFDIEFVNSKYDKLDYDVDYAMQNNVKHKIILLKLKDKYKTNLLLHNRVNCFHSLLGVYLNNSLLKDMIYVICDSEEDVVGKFNLFLNKFSDGISGLRDILFIFKKRVNTINIKNKFKSFNIEITTGDFNNLLHPTEKDALFSLHDSLLGDNKFDYNNVNVRFILVLISKPYFNLRGVFNLMRVCREGSKIICGNGNLMKHKVLDNGLDSCSLELAFKLYYDVECDDNYYVLSRLTPAFGSFRLNHDFINVG